MALYERSSILEINWTVPYNSAIKNTVIQNVNGQGAVVYLNIINSSYLFI